jgi:hypothetical protein
MPFKGDLRLGGPHDNEARLNGSSDGPSVPAAGTVLQTGLTAPVFVSGSLQNGEFVQLQTGTDTYNVVADGIGGTYNVVTAQNWVPSGTFIGPVYSQSPAYSDYDGVSYPNGKFWASRFVSDGMGEFTIGYEVEQVGDYYTSGTLVNGAPQYSISDQFSERPSEMVSVPNGKYSYDSLVWTGSGGIEMSTGGPFTGGSFYPYGTLESDASDTTIEVPEYSGNYYFDGNDNRWEWDGNGNIVFRYSGLYPHGTYITNYGDYNYYWDGTGGFYSEYSSSSGGGGSSYPPSGESTGNGSSTPIYVFISNLIGNYQIGTNDCVEYHDGNGSTYTSCTNNYYSYGTWIANDSNNNYYSDGTGYYYSEWYDNSGGGGFSTGPTGNTSSGTNFLYIEGLAASFENGTYYSTEYNDGNGGTYWDTSYTYRPYGETFTFQYTYDSENMQDVYTYYYSDGNGSYYTGS